MKQFIFSFVIVLALAALSRAQSTNTLPVFNVGQMTDAFRDLGCVRVTAQASTISAATAAANVAKINAWMSKAPASGRDAILYVTGGYIAINGTLGAPSPQRIDGYNGGQPVNFVPSGMQILCGGGWANGRYSVNNTVNQRTAGFMWVGGTDQPMIRLCGNGNVIRANLFGYRYIDGADVPTVARCRSAVEMIQLKQYYPCGHHDLALTASGFDKAIRIEQNATGHCDHLLFERLTTRNCLTTFYCDDYQAVNHKFNFVEHYCPVGEQSTVFDYEQGGAMKADMVAVTGDYGATLLTIKTGGSNTGSYIIDGLQVDRAILNATQAGKGYFRLLNKLGGGTFAVWIRGHMHFGGADISQPDWQNAGREPTVVIDPDAKWSTLRLDVVGLDQNTAAAYPR